MSIIARAAAPKSQPIRILMIFIQCACAAAAGTMIKCSNGSDMCPERPSLTSSRGAGSSCRAGEEPRRAPLPPSFPAIGFEPKANCRRQRQSSSKRRRLTCRLLSLFRLSGFRMTEVGKEGRKWEGEGRGEGEEAHSARPSGGRSVGRVWLRPGR